MVSRTRSNKSWAFTLIELLVVIAVIGILSTLILVSINSSRAKAKDTKLKSNMAAIYSSLNQYQVANNASYPDSEAEQIALDSAAVTTALSAFFGAGQTSAVFVFDDVTTGYATPLGGAYFAAACGLNHKGESTIGSGNGVYQTNADGVEGRVTTNGVMLSAINSGVDDLNGRAFVIYGPQ